jgi:hypothetical protein
VLKYTQSGFWDHSPSSLVNRYPWYLFHFYLIIVHSTPIYLFYLFSILCTNHSQSLPPYPTESECYLYLYSTFFYLLPIVVHSIYYRLVLLLVTYQYELCYDFKQCIWTKPVLAFGTERSSIVNSRGLGSKRSQRSSQVRVRWVSQRVPLQSGIVLESLRTIYQIDQTKF